MQSGLAAAVPGAVGLAAGPEQTGGLANVTAAEADIVAVAAGRLAGGGAGVVLQAGPAAIKSLPETNDLADIAAATLYLASTESSFVTGQVLRVNGGLYM